MQVHEGAQAQAQVQVQVQVPTWMSAAATSAMSAAPLPSRSALYIANSTRYWCTVAWLYRP